MTDSMNSLMPWHHKAWKLIQSEKQQDRLHHAFLVTGLSGTGRKQFVHRLAESLLCQQPDSAGHACGVCKSCQVMKSDSHPDFRTIAPPEGKYQIPVDTIRELTAFMSLTRSYGQYRVAIIDPADAMNVNAANSLLKTLEEPPSQTVIILLTENPSRLLPTIRSRCRLITLPAPDKKASYDWLNAQLSTHTATADSHNNAELLMSLSGGRPLTALELEQNKELQDTYHALLKDTFALLNESLTITDFSKQWKKIDMMQLLRWQLMWVVHSIKQTSGIDHQGGNNQRNTLPDFKQHIPSFAQQWYLYDNLLKSMQWVESPLNQESFIEQIAIYWLNARKRI